jgi:hypothetical protein
MTVDKEALFKARLPEAEVEVPGLGSVRVRALSRAEAMSVQQMNGTGAIERRILHLALVDPELTEAEVGQWQKVSPAGELEPVTDKITELSGMEQGAAKEAYLGFEENPDAEFPVLPGGEAVDDGGRDDVEDR